MNKFTKVPGLGFLKLSFAPDPMQIYKMEKLSASDGTVLIEYVLIDNQTA